MIAWGVYSSFSVPKGPPGKNSIYTSKPITVVGTPTRASKTPDITSTYFLDILEKAAFKAKEDKNAIRAAIDET
jgi:hypothetical protein